MTTQFYDLCGEAETHIMRAQAASDRGDRGNAVVETRLATEKFKAARSLATAARSEK